MSAASADGARENARALNQAPQRNATSVETAARVRTPISHPNDICVPVRGEFRLENGGVLPDANVRVRLFGRRGAPPVVVMGGISSGRKLTGPDGWWSELVGEGSPVDLAHYCAIGIDFAPAGDDRVAMSPHSQAQLLALAVDELRIERLHAIVGASYGGMVALAFAALAPERIGALCVVSAAHKPSPMAMGWRGVQRRIVEFALEQKRGEDGLALARQLAMITYRSSAEFEQRFQCVLGQDGFSDLDRYLVARGRAYGEVMSPRRWLSLSEAIDRCQVTPEAILTPMTLVACPTDQLIPLADVRELASRLPNLTTLHTLPSIYGHDAFLKEHERLGGIVRSFLRCA
jgi:homoserine O-acetyltransferase